MTGKQLFDSLQYLDDALIEVSEPSVRAVHPKRPALRWAAGVAAGLVVIAGAVLALSRPGTCSLPAATGNCSLLPAGTENAAGEQAGRNSAMEGAPLPDGVPESEAEDPNAEAASLTLVWNERSADGADGLEADMGVLVVSEPLTAAQRADCAPELRPEWMDTIDGWAAYYLHDGSGGLAWIDLTVTNGGAGRRYSVRLRDADAPDLPSCYVYQPETDGVGSVNGLECRAYRLRYWHGEGEPDANPPAEWVDLTVLFEREGVAYTLSASCPAESEDAASADLADLLLCYSGTHVTPDLSAFRCGEHVLIDESLTLDGARADADFGVYLPEGEPEGLSFEDARRYKLDEAADYLLALWSDWNGAHRELFWLAETPDGEALARIVSADEPERWDLRLYPAPWTRYAAQTDWLTLEDPVFPVGMLTQEVVEARTRADYDGLPYCNLSVLCESGVLVRVRAKGVDTDWLYEALSGLC